MYQRQLDRVDEARVDGNFLDAEGKPADLHAQRVRKSVSASQCNHIDLNLDTIISASSQLCLHLCSPHLFGTCFRSASTHLQAIANAAPLSGGGQEIRRHLQSSRIVPVQHESKQNVYLLRRIKC